MSQIKMTRGERVFQVFNILLLVILSLIFILPFITVFSTSFVSEAESVRRGSFVLWPEEINTGAYKMLLSKNSPIWRAYGVTIAVIVVGTSLNLAVTTMLSYGLSKQFLPGRSFFITLIFITMIITGGLLPTYIVVKSLGILNTFWALILPGVVSTWNFMVLKSFFVNLPQSLEESAMLDGATPFRILVSVVLPISIPALATIGLFYAVGHWNSWFGAALYISDKDLYPLQIILRNTILVGSGAADMERTLRAERAGGAQPTSAAIRSACIIITTVPILCIYPFIQKYFVQGVMVGSIKE